MTTTNTPDLSVLHVVSSMFTWNRADRTGAACASDLGIRAGDDMPSHLDIRSEVSGASVLMWIKSMEAKDGDLISTDYYAVVDGKFVTVTVFND